MNTQTLKISVVIPVFNNATMAMRAVASVLRQTSPASEILLVDDASQPDCQIALRRSIARCQSKNPIKLIVLPQNEGPGMARHYGAANAIGSYVAFLDADDQWHNRKLELIGATIHETGADLLGHERPWKFAVRRLDLETALVKYTPKVLSTLAFLRRNPIPTSSIVASLEIARSMFRHGGRRSEDYMALLIAKKQANVTVYLNSPLSLASKPPFGVAGEGSNQIAIYRASVTHMVSLRRKGILTTGELSIFFIFLTIRAPVGILKYFIYKVRYAD